MGRISPGYAKTALVFGILELICGLVLTICALVLSSKVSSSFSVSGNGQLATFTGINYWWGGSPFIVPGILGIVTFCTRNVCVATMHLIFNIICFFVAAACAGIAGLLLGIWSAVVTLYNDGSCVSTNSQCICRLEDYTVRLGATCDIVSSFNSLFMGMAAAAGIGAMVILICCYINCVSLCNQEQDQMPGFVLAPAGGMVYQTQPPQMVAGHTGNQQQPPPTYQVHEHDKAQLVYNQA